MNIGNARVVVVDDNIEEVETLLENLNKEGIPFNYYDGTPSLLPSTPLKDIKFLFLDFVVNTDGQSDTTKMSTLMKLITKIISIDNGPYIIFGWTKHLSLIRKFKSSIYANNNCPKPIKFIPLDKKNSLHSIKKINSELKTKFKDDEIFKLFLKWDSHVTTSKNEVFNILYELSKPDLTQASDLDKYIKKINKQFEKHAYKFSEAHLGKDNIKKDNILKGTHITLSSLLNDRVVENIIKEKKVLPKVSSRLIQLKNTYKYKEYDVANLNSLYLFEKVNMSPYLQPGNIYKFSSIWGKIRNTNQSIGTQKIIKSFFNYKQIKKPNVPKKIVSELSDKCIPILMEVSPLCDYAQNKWKTTKFILGILRPTSLKNSTQKIEKILWKADNIKYNIPIYYDGEIYYLSFNSHYIFTGSRNPIKSNKAIMKARKELLTHVQHWYSSHISRPAFIEFR